MNKRFFSLLTAAALLVSLALAVTAAPPARAAGFENLPILYTTVPETQNINTGLGGPDAVCIIRADHDAAVRAVVTYHGTGARPGAVSVWQDDEVLLGVWKAEGGGDEGHRNTRWVIYPDIVFEAGHAYYIYVSDPTGWTCSAAAGIGYADIRGSEDPAEIAACREASAHPGYSYIRDAYASSIRIDTVRSGPTAPAELAVGLQDIRLEALTTSHWNDGFGASPGTIALTDCATGEILGPWQAVGEYEGDTADAAWVVYPKIVLKAAHRYRITVSDSASWTCSDATGGCGMYEIVGETLGTGFVPVKVSAWAEAEVRRTVEGFLFPPYLADKDLTAPITRAEFAAVAVHLYESLTDRPAPDGGVPLRDIGGHPLEESMRKAYLLNAAMGVTETRFDPDAPLTREQMAAMLLRVLKKVRFSDWTLADDSLYPLEYTMPAAFSDDARISDWAYDSVYCMVSRGIVNGIGGGKFDPQGTATREQALAIAVRIQN